MNFCFQLEIQLEGSKSGIAETIGRTENGRIRDQFLHDFQEEEKDTSSNGISVTKCCSHSNSNSIGRSSEIIITLYNINLFKYNFLSTSFIYL